MPVNTLLHVISFTLLLTLTVSLSHPPEYSPSPSPLPLSSPFSVSDDTIPAPSPSAVSPPAPPPSDLTDSKSLDEHSPSPAPTTVSGVSAEVKSEEPKKSSAGGMSAGKKVGVAFGLIAAVSCVIFAGVLYRKRQRNIRRAQYSQSARLEFF